MKSNSVPSLNLARDYIKMSLKELHTLAKKNVEAQFYLGKRINYDIEYQAISRDASSIHELMHELKLSVDGRPDILDNDKLSKERYSWYEKAAKQNHVGAQCELAWFYLKDAVFIPSNYKKAAKWYKEAAKNNHAVAQDRLGDLYMKGNGVAQDEKEAVKWYNKSANQNWGYAQYALGKCYENGTGVPKDKEEAVKWYRRAAERYDEEIYTRNARKALQQLGVAFNNPSVQYYNGEYGKLIEHFNQRVAQDPYNRDKLSDKATVLFFLDRLDEALNCYDEILKIDSKFYPATIMSKRGYVLLSQKNFAGSRALFEQALAEKGNYHGAILGKGLLAMIEGESKIAESFFKECETVWQENCKKGYKENSDAYKESIHTFYVQAKLLTQFGFIDRAIISLGKILELNPSFVPAQREIKSLQEKRKVRDKLERYYEESIQFFYKGQYDKAIENCNQVLALDPKNLKALAYKAWLLFCSSQLDESLRYYDEALKVNPKSAYCLCEKGYVLLLQKQFKASDALFEQVLTFSKENVRAFLGKGLLTMRDDPFGLAESFFQKIETEKLEAEDKLELYFVQAKVLAELGFVTQAIKAFERTLQLKPDFIPAQQEMNKLKGSQIGKNVIPSSLITLTHSANVNLKNQDDKEKKTSLDSKSNPLSVLLTPDAEEKLPKNTELTTTSHMSSTFKSSSSESFLHPLGVALPSKSDALQNKDITIINDQSSKIKESNLSENENLENESKLNKNMLASSTIVTSNENANVSLSQQNREEKISSLSLVSSDLQPVLMRSQDQDFLNAWLLECKSFTISPADLLQFKQHIQQSYLDQSEMQVALRSMKTMLQTLSTLDDQVKNISEHLDLDEASKTKQAYINNNQKLKRYQSCLQSELNKFVLTYYLATTELQQLTANKKDSIIEGVMALPTSIPIVGKLLNVFTHAAKAANLSHRYEQINRLVVLFKEPRHIAQVAYRFSVQLTLEKRKIITEEAKEINTVADHLIKFLENFKKFFRHQLKDMKTSNTKGLSLTREEELAMEDGASLLAVILSDQAKIDREKDLVLQFLQLVLGHDYVYSKVEDKLSQLNVSPTETPASSSVIRVPIAAVNPSTTASSQHTSNEIQNSDNQMIIIMQEIQVLKAKSQAQEEELKHTKAKLEEQEKAKKLENELVTLRKKIAQIDRIEEKIHRVAEVDDVLARIKALGLDDLPSVDEVEENGQVKIQTNESAGQPKNHFIRLHKQMFFFEQHTKVVVEELLKLKEQVETMQARQEAASTKMKKKS